jgi:hypothetical protein
MTETPDNNTRPLPPRRVVGPRRTTRPAPGAVPNPPPAETGEEATAAPRPVTGQATGLQYIADQVAEVLGIEQIIVSVEQDLAARSNLADFRSNLERFASQDMQHLENLFQILRMMGVENQVQPSVERGRGFAEAVMAASQGSPFSLIRGLLHLVYQTAVAGRAFLATQQRIENREIVGLLETDHFEDEQHLRYLEAQYVRAAEELSGVPWPQR